MLIKANTNKTSSNDNLILNDNIFLTSFWSFSIKIFSRRKKYNYTKELSKSQEGQKDG
jgi:hypothetical protein